MSSDSYKSISFDEDELGKEYNKSGRLLILSCSFPFDKEGNDVWWV